MFVAELLAQGVSKDQIKSMGRGDTGRLLMGKASRARGQMRPALRTLVYSLSSPAARRGKTHAVVHRAKRIPDFCGSFSVRFMINRLGGRLTRLLDVDASLEISAFLDDDAGCHQVPHDRPGLADRNVVHRTDLPFDHADHNDFLGVNIGLHLTVGSDRQVVIPQLDGSLYLPVDIEVLTAGQFALDVNGFSDVRDGWFDWFVHHLRLSVGGLECEEIQALLPAPDTMELGYLPDC